MQEMQKQNTLGRWRDFPSSSSIIIHSGQNISTPPVKNQSTFLSSLFINEKPKQTREDGWWTQVAPKASV